MGEYSDLYLKTDVLLLADIFENFRSNCFSTYQLDPLHYYTAPGFSFDAMLKYTQVELELFTDVEMHLFIEKGIRGGVAQCINRYGKANHQYMGEAYNPELPESYLMYFDVNNLYGAAMMQSLPYAAFEWESNLTIDIRIIPIDSSIGYILEVDLDYPEELHESHKDLRLCPEHFTAKKSMNPKLMTTFLPKKQYVIHYVNLQQHLQMGLKLTKVHRILKFKQASWLKSYIDLNTQMRMNCKNEFEKNFYKLMNNAVFGKTMENVRKRKCVKLVTQWKGRYGANALVIIELNNTKAIFNRPIYVGFSILDLSKTYIYDFHYNYIQPTFNSHAKLLYTDTDSLLYQFIESNIYDFIKRDSHKFDTSDYPTNNIFGIPLLNKKKIGLMKDECKGKIITEFVGLRAKLYTFKLLGEKKEKKRAKGIKGATLKTITFDDYKKCLFNHETVTKFQCLIRSKIHRVHTIMQKKLALSWQDDKRILSPYTTGTVPWGYKIKQFT